MLEELNNILQQEPGKTSKVNSDEGGFQDAEGGIAEEKEPMSNGESEEAESEQIENGNADGG